jgi:hypothetical protein
MSNPRISVGAGLFLAGVSFLASASSLALADDLNPQPLPPSPGMALAMPAGPDTRVKMTEEYAKLVARDAYFWAWPMVNIFNRRQTFKDVTEIVMAGPVPTAPLNRFAMLTDYITPDQRVVACPNQDVVYGAGSLALDITPVVIQVPDFGDRFWVYQVVDLRTDGVVQLGKMYGTTPGFYMVVGPDWKGRVPDGITRVFRSTTNTGFIAPRIFQDDTAEDRRAIQPVLQQVMMYPLSEYDGTMKMKDWSGIKKLPPKGTASESETQWVFPEKFFDELAAVLADAPPMPGEEARYGQIRALLEAIKKDPALKAALIKTVAEADDELVKPLFQFRNYGQQLPHHWTTINNEAAFGTDYYTRTAAAKSNILVNSPNETKYFYQDLDAGGARLNGANHYTVTFAKDQTPPVNGFWSLTLYNEHHFFAPNELRRYSLGTKNKNLTYNSDGSLTILVQADPPPEAQRNNWLPSPKNNDFSLYVRAYWPKAPVLDGAWTPPPVEKLVSTIGAGAK